MKKTSRAIALILSVLLLSTLLSGCLLDTRTQMLPKQFYGKYYELYHVQDNGHIGEGYNFTDDPVATGIYAMELDIHKKSRLDMIYGDSSRECEWKAYKDGSFDLWWGSYAATEIRKGSHAEDLICLPDNEHESWSGYRILIRSQIDLSDPLKVLKKADKPKSCELTQERTDLFWRGLDEQYFKAAREEITPVAYLGTAKVQSGTDHIYLCSVNDSLWIDAYQIFFIRERKDGSCILDGRVNTNISCEVESWFNDGAGSQYQYQLETAAAVPERVSAAIKKSLGSGYDPMCLIGSGTVLDRWKVLCLHGREYEVVKVSFNEDGSNEIINVSPMVHEFSEDDDFPIRHWTSLGNGAH